MNKTKSVDQWINYFEEFNIKYDIVDRTLRMYCLSSPHWEFFFSFYDEDDDYRIVIHEDTPFDPEVIEYTYMYCS